MSQKPLSPTQIVTQLLRYWVRNPRRLALLRPFAALGNEFGRLDVIFRLWCGVLSEQADQRSGRQGDADADEHDLPEPCDGLDVRGHSRPAKGRVP